MTVGNAANVSKAILETIASFDWNVLIPATSEDQMKVLASNYTLQQELNITTVLGGVVMENFVLDSGGQLQSVDIRIRLNSTYVPATDTLRQRWVELRLRGSDGMVEGGGQGIKVTQIGRIEGWGGV